MKISYNWLKNYIDYLPTPEETAEILTNTGLEVEGMEHFESVKGGLKGVVIGEVLSCEKHPDADKLSITKVDIGNGTILPIVCGAPNVAAGQKVPVATVGTTLYSDTDSFEIKKAKIRGEVSEGMICAEDELGLGTGHEGIMVLDPAVKIGTAASEFFKIETDVVFEIGLTPNRIDGASHFGVARDIAAYLRQSREIKNKMPDVDLFKVDNNNNPIDVVIEDKEGCIRYSGLTISGIEIKDSPSWLQNKLKSIGLKPINNIVDITNFVLHEIGQPLHAFDADKVTGNKVIVKTLPEGTIFKTLDEVERKLSDKDLMICNEKEGMCIAGVFGGIDSGVSEKTKNIFLESACFNPVYIRKTSKRHILNTDSSFRFERGSDPNITVYALKRAALLIKELGGGTISSKIQDIYPEKISDVKIELSYEYLNRLTGKIIEKEIIRNILASLDIQIERETEETLNLRLPAYRVDVTRPSDVAEEIMRIYGYNNIETGNSIRSSISYRNHPDREKLINLVSDLLSSNGFNEIMSNSLTPSSYYEQEEKTDKELVRIVNPLSSDLNALRKNLLFGGLEAILYNTNRRNADLRLFEFGNVYHIDPDKKSENPHDKYNEQEQLALFLTGEKYEANWISPSSKTNFYQLKSYVEMILRRLGFKPEELKSSNSECVHLKEGLSVSINEKEIVQYGTLSKKVLDKFDISRPVYFAVFKWDNILKQLTKNSTKFIPLSKFPEVKRDLSMLIDNSVKYEDIKNLAEKTERNILKKVSLFDVFEGDKIEKGKKSYAISFVLQDEHKTLEDKQIDKVMKKLIAAFERELNAQIRS
jgi:phenylalanyl-tRNA synthetase beta chain